MSEEIQEKLIEQQHCRWSIRIAWDGEFDEKNHDIEDIIADEHNGPEFVQGCVRWLFRFGKHEILHLRLCEWKGLSVSFSVEEPFTNLRRPSPT